MKLSLIIVDALLLLLCWPLYMGADPPAPKILKFNATQSHVIEVAKMLNQMLFIQPNIEGIGIEKSEKAKKFVDNLGECFNEKRQLYTYIKKPIQTKSGRWEIVDAKKLTAECAIQWPKYLDFLGLYGFEFIQTVWANLVENKCRDGPARGPCLINAWLLYSTLQKMHEQLVKIYRIYSHEKPQSAMDFLRSKTGRTKTAGAHAEETKKEYKKFDMVELGKMSPEVLAVEMGVFKKELEIPNELLEDIKSARQHHKNKEVKTVKEKTIKLLKLFHKRIAKILATVLEKSDVLLPVFNKDGQMNISGEENYLLYLMKAINLSLLQEIDPKVKDIFANFGLEITIIPIAKNDHVVNEKSSRKGSKGTTDAKGKVPRPFNRDILHTKDWSEIENSYSRV